MISKLLKQRLFIITSIVLFSILFSFFLTGCTKKEEEVELTLSNTSFLFNTVITIELYDYEDETVLNEALNLCQEYENLFSRTIETSDISRINTANGEPVIVSDDTIELLQLGLYYSELSDGAFDITIAPLSDLWDFTSDEDVIPDDEDIQEALEHIDYRMIDIDGNEVTLEDPKGMIDLGGIAKGYIADKIKEYLMSENVEHGIINLGGNVLTIGAKPDDSYYVLGIQEPFADTGTAITNVSICDMSVVTSGIYERYFESEGMIYHHILDTDTGYPIINDLYSVSIVSDSSVEGDALSTICMTKGLEEGMLFLQELGTVEGIFVTNELEMNEVAILETEE